MKKCLLLIPRMGGGGAERVMATIANNLCRDHEVRIVSMTNAESFYRLEDRVEIVGLGQTINRKNKLTKLFSGAIGGVKAFFGLKKTVKRWDPDVILSFLPEANFLAILLKLFGTKCRVVVSERNDPTVRGWLNRWFERKFYPVADGIVCQSQKAAGFFSQEVRAKIKVIPNPLSADAIPNRFEGVRRKTVVAVGRLDKQKNFAMLIDAFSRLSDAYKEYRLEIYGGGKLETALNEQIERLGLVDRVSLMGVRSNVMHHIADAALYVMSSDYEGFPNALAEAMATGLPVISTDFPTGVARELIGEKNGIVIPVGDEAALVEAMTEMLSDESRWDDMSRANRELLETLSESRVMVLWNESLALSEQDKTEMEKEDVAV